jgi:hypothetical protein
VLTQQEDQNAEYDSNQKAEQIARRGVKEVTRGRILHRAALCAVWRCAVYAPTATRMGII